jgi:hypothetical protein
MQYTIRRGSTVRAAFLMTAFGAILGGCGSHSASTDQAQPTAAADNGATTAAATSAPQDATPVAAAAAGTIPVYPGAKQQPMPAGVTIPSMCGHKVTISSYDVAVSGKTVAAWYKDHVPGGLVLDVSGDADSSTKDISVEIFTADGSQAAVVNQLEYDPRLAGAAKTIGADKTQIGLETFTPPLSQDYLAIMSQGTSGDQAAKEAAKTKLAAMCPNG